MKWRVCIEKASHLVKRKQQQQKVYNFFFPLSHTYMVHTTDNDKHSFLWLCHSLFSAFIFIQNIKYFSYLLLLDDDDDDDVSHTDCN